MAATHKIYIHLTYEGYESAGQESYWFGDDCTAESDDTTVTVRDGAGNVVLMLARKFVDALVVNKI